MKKIICYIMLLLLAACDRDKDVINIGTLGGPEGELIIAAKEYAAKCYGLKLNIIEFSDYNIPNTGLADGSIDVNVFQHKPFLDEQISSRNYKLVAIGNTFIYPMGLYSNKLKSLSEIYHGAKIAIPNDPTNEARALLLLEQAKLIKVNPKRKTKATVIDILENPKNLKFIELDASHLPRVLEDVTAAVINANFATVANLKLDSAIFIESRDSLYANIIVVREADANKPEYVKLLAAIQSNVVAKKASDLFNGSAIVAWDVATNRPLCEK